MGSTRVGGVQSGLSGPVSPAWDLRRSGVRGHRPPQAFMIYQICSPHPAGLITGRSRQRFRFSTYLRSSPSCGPSRVQPWPIGSGESWVDPEPGRPRLRGGHVVPITLRREAPWRPLSSSETQGISDGQHVPHNLPMPSWGGLLWFGWFGFKCGERASPRASCRPRPSWRPTSPPPRDPRVPFVEWLHRGSDGPSKRRRMRRGLVAITPGVGLRGAPGALVIGTAAGRVCYSASCSRAARIRRLARPIHYSSAARSADPRSS